MGISAASPSRSAARESRIAVLENDILRNEESAASLQQEIAPGSRIAAEADAALQRHRAVAKTMEAAGEKLAAEIEALNEELARLARCQQRQRCPQGHPAGRACRPDSQAHRSTGGTGRRRSRRGNGPQRLPALEQSVQEKHRPAGRSKAGSGRHHQVPPDAGRKRKAAGKCPLRAGTQAENRKAALDEADTAEQRLGRELDAARQRLSVLRELEKNMDGYQNSVKAVMRAAGARRLRGIIGPVSAI